MNVVVVYIIIKKVRKIMNCKKNLSEVNLKELIDEILDEMYKKHDGNDNCKEFDKIWEEKFVACFDCSKGDFKKNRDGKYENQIIQTIYDKFHDFYFNDCQKIKEDIKKIKSDVDNILKEAK